MLLNKLFLLGLLISLPLQAAEPIAVPSTGAVAITPLKLDDIKKALTAPVVTQKLELHRQGLPSEFVTQKLELHRFFVPTEWQTSALELHKKVFPNELTTAALELHRQPPLIKPLSTVKKPALIKPVITPVAPAGSLSMPSPQAIQLPKPAEGNAVIKPIMQTAPLEEKITINPANSLIKPISIKPNKP